MMSFIYLTEVVLGSENMFREKKKHGLSFFYLKKLGNDTNM